MLEQHYTEGFIENMTTTENYPKLIIISFEDLQTRIAYFIPLPLKPPCILLTNTVTRFLPLLLSEYSLYYASIEKISLLILSYKLLLKTIIPVHKKMFVCTLHESTSTYLTLRIHFLWHTTVTGVGEGFLGESHICSAR